MKHYFSLSTYISMACLLASAIPASAAYRYRENPGLSGEFQHGLNKSDWAQVRALYERHRRSSFAVGGEHLARNPRQQWLERFNGRGFLVRPDSAAWCWGLELKSYGFTGFERVIAGNARVIAAAERIKYFWGSQIQEWFINEAEGLEHGFTVVTRPQGEGDRLHLSLEVIGTLRPEGAGDALVFVDSERTPAVRYSGLKAWDATGKTLPARFETIDGSHVRIAIDTSGASYPITIDPIAQQAYIKASNTEAGDYFGWSVALAADTLVVGAWGESSGTTGVNGNQADNTKPQAGAAYVFVRQSGIWSQQAYLKASNTDSGDAFGYSVAVFGDTVVIGANGEASGATGVNASQSDNSKPQAGAAYVFLRTNGSWSQQAYLKASNSDAADAFGSVVALSGDTAIVGAYGESSSATGINGTQSDNSLSKSGAAYVFQRQSGVWVQQAYLKASNTDADDRFGSSVAVSADTAVIGAPQESSSAAGVNGVQSDNSASRAGAAYVFLRQNGVWSQQAYLKASNTNAADFFGGSVAISADTVLVGASGEASDATGVNGNQTDNSAFFAGAAYVFQRQSGVWVQQSYLKASNTDPGDRFGTSVSIAGDTAIIGAYGESSAATGTDGNQADNSKILAGAAYVFFRQSGVWKQVAYTKASNTDAGDDFGLAVAVSGDTAVAGAYVEASNATGVNGNQTDNTMRLAGAAYTLLVPPCTLSISLSYQSGMLKGTETLGALVPLTLTTYAVGSFGVRPVSSLSIPVLDPPLQFTFSVPVGPIGYVGLLAILATPNNLACWDLEVVNTGGFGPTKSAVRRLAESFLERQQMGGMVPDPKP